MNRYLGKEGKVFPGCQQTAWGLARGWHTKRCFLVGEGGNDLASFSVPVPHLEGRFVSSDKHKLRPGLDVFVVGNAIEPTAILLVTAWRCFFFFVGGGGGGADVV